MVAKLDIYRTAHLLMKRHGDNARLEAGMRADRQAACGAMAGYRLWCAVTAAIEELQNAQIPPGTPRH